MASESAKVMDSPRLYSFDIQRSGGKWLATARTWLQSNVMNGDHVRWGSGEMIYMTERQYEDAAAHIAAAAVNEDRERRARSAPATNQSGNSDAT